MRSPDHSAWILAAGVALAAIGLARVPQGQTGQTQVVASPPANSTADSNNRMIAVTGTDVTGASILYLVDTESMHMAVYQAAGGSKATQSIRLVGARRIDLDLSLDGYNDQSEYSYKDLRKRFDQLSGAGADDESDE